MFVERYYRQLRMHNLSELGLAIKVNDSFNLKWDNLTLRIHCILANMHGFSAGELLKYSYRQVIPK